jgi:hypothetical protein
MTGAFDVEWLAGGVLLQRRSGMLSVEQAQQYVSAVLAAIKDRPDRWGAVVDTRNAGVQTEEVQAILQGLMQVVAANNVARVALVSTSVVTQMQQRRLTTAPGMHDPSTLLFFTDLDEAVAAVRKHLTD